MNPTDAGFERAALITGASRGIGLAIAHMLGEEGHSLTIVGRSADGLASAAAELRDRGFPTLEVVSDISAGPGDDEVRRVVAAHENEYGRLDVLVNNAGVGVPTLPITGLETEALDWMIATNLRPVPLFYRQAMPMLKAAAAEHGHSHVINTSSSSGLEGDPVVSVYSATKFAIVGFTQAMNRELGDSGVKSCALCPALVNTDMTRNVLGDAVDYDRMIQPTDIANMVRAVINLSPACVVSELSFLLPGLVTGVPDGFFDQQ